MKIRAGSAMELTMLRLGLVCAGALLLRLGFAVALTAPLSQSPADVGILIAVGFAGLLLLTTAARPQPPFSLRWLILAACIAELAVRSLVWAQTAHLPDRVMTDAALYSDFAGQLIRRGQNPYAWDLSGAFDLYRTTQALSTPILNGAITSNYPYPALAFLLVVPFQALGLPGSFALLLLAQAATLVLLFAASPKSAQPLILIPIVAGFDFTTLTYIGSQDFIWSALLVGMILTWHRPRLRAIFFGLAASVKQAPWLVLPFLIIRLWRDESGESPIRRVSYFSVVSAATFLTINGPFIFWDAAAWFRGVVEPLSGNLVVLGHGFSSLTQFGFAALPKSYYLVVTLAAFGLLLLAYWRHYEALRDTFWILPGIFMWFSYRSLVSYWIYWIPPLLATLVTRSPPATVAGRGPGWRLTFAIAASTTVILLGIGVFSLPASPLVEVVPGYPFTTTGGRVTQMTVEVVNHSHLSLAPRFMVQRQTSNPLPWHIERGPDSLLPGESAEYEIYTHQDDRSFYGHEGAQVIVTDAGGDYSLRGVTTVEPDPSFLWPDAIPNPAYLFWEEGRGAPLFWGLIATPPDSGLAGLVHHDGRDALRLTLEAEQEGMNRVALENWVIFPSAPFGIWVYSESLSESPSAVAYGLEIDDGQHQLLILFGPEGYTGPRAEGQYIVTRRVPPRTWVYQTIDLPALYDEAGWPRPKLKPASFRGLDVDLPLINLRLILAADGPHGHLDAYFGPIEQAAYRIEPKTLMAETLSDPASYYVRLAQAYSRDRNYSRALEAYRRALQFSPDDPAIVEAMRRVDQHLAEESFK